MDNINESSILIEIYKRGGHIASYAQLAEFYHTVQGEQSAAKLANSIESIFRKGFIKEIELNPTNFRLTPEGEDETIKLLTINSSNYPLNKYEIAIINYTLKQLNVWYGQIHFNSNTEQYLYKKEGFFELNKLKDLLSDNVRDYLYENDFIELCPGTYSIYKLKYGKGEQLHRAGSIEKYWKKEEEANSKYTGYIERKGDTIVNINNVFDSNFNFNGTTKLDEENSLK